VQNEVGDRAPRVSTNSRERRPLAISRLTEDDAAHPARRRATGFRAMLALRVMAAVANGERDPQRLRLVALSALDA